MSAAVTRLLDLPRRYRPWVPAHLRLVLRDIVAPGRAVPGRHDEHALAAIQWLERAQDRREGQPDAGGVSAGWSFEDGWLPSYPETSGYIVETFLAAARSLERPSLVDRAQRILDWELGLQLPDGAFPGHFGEAGSRPVIFNTGQIMHGLIAGYGQLGRPECLAAAVRAGRWMLAQQDADGCWRRSVHNGIPHTYNTRAAWALLRTGLLADEPMLVRAARANLDWALTQQDADGWFRNNAFREGEPPFTHTIAYAARGLLESGLLLGESRYVVAAERTARALAGQQRADGFLAGAFAAGWVGEGRRYCCLTGLAQTALIWQRLAQTPTGHDLAEHAERAIAYLKRQHRRRGDGAPDDGGIAGSAPIWGRYSRFEYPNWAAKFFADALLVGLSGEPVPAADPVVAAQGREVADA
ncbi:prenyltransferase/squalene oxidase repeat-containing protein [Sediminicurvatus halobius]|uniref:Squalene cyclase C-terminal domain-containing protein n=1 Tax=Sediminicurvatus halobius TaxID=2182432 RepID=A0A2U2N0U2_9GAMM|nr:prenyltransferase/squalene oxidase repeat-containing protein [Spiribacter halobius]PWG62678.1 hypothetical protein DEM34_11035 [Spiribacter halobius]UEX77347.1 terpene cyclase/mutase family protein [Spiribacter halobius]